MKCMYPNLPKPLPRFSVGRLGVYVSEYNLPNISPEVWGSSSPNNLASQWIPHISWNPLITWHQLLKLLLGPGLPDGNSINSQAEVQKIPKFIVFKNKIPKAWLFAMTSFIYLTICRALGKRGRGRPRVAWMQNVRDYTGLLAIEAVTAAQDRTDWRKSWGFDSAPTVLVDYGLEEERKKKSIPSYIKASNPNENTKYYRAISEIPKIYS